MLSAIAKNATLMRGSIEMLKEEARPARAFVWTKRKVRS